MISPKKIYLHLSPLAEVGGCEINCLRVIGGLEAYDHHVVVFAGRGPMSARWEELGARVHHLDAWNKGGQKFRIALASWAKPQPAPAGIFYWSTSRLPTVVETLRHWQVPLVVHGGNPVAGGVVPGLRRWMQERIHPTPRSVRLAACSRHVAESHQRACYFRHLTTEVIHNAVDPEFDRPREYRPLPAGSAPRIGMVARLDLIKDHATVIRTLAGIAAARPDLVVEFAGTGPLKKNLENEARRLGVAQQVRFLGHTHVGPLLAEWDLLVRATTSAEGMGTAVAEAMMAGLPCVISDLPMMREVGGDNGAVYFAPGDASALGEILIELIDDQVRRKAIGQAAQERARRLFAQTLVAEAYERAVSGKEQLSS